MDLIRKSINLASLPMPVEEELFNRAEVWAEELFNIVPESRLEDCFSRAFKDHSSSFAINAFEVKAAWDNLAREDRIAEYKRIEAEADALDRKRRLAEFKVCPICHGTGFKTAGTREFAGRDYPGVERSYGCCDYWERRRQNNERGRMDKIDKG